MGKRMKAAKKPVDAQAFAAVEGTDDDGREAGFVGRVGGKGGRPVGELQLDLKKESGTWKFYTGKFLSPEQNDRVRDLLRELLTRHGGNQSVVAPMLGVTQPTLSAFLSGRQGTSFRFAIRVAEELRLDVRSVFELMPKVPEKSEEEVEEHTFHVPQWTEPEKARQNAIEAGRTLGIDERAVWAVRKVPITGERLRMSAWSWFDLLRGEAARLTLTDTPEDTRRRLLEQLQASLPPGTLPPNMTLEQALWREVARMRDEWQKQQDDARKEARQEADRRAEVMRQEVAAEMAAKRERPSLVSTRAGVDETTPEPTKAEDVQPTRRVRRRRRP